MTLPFVSIIVPTFHRQEALAACLEAIRGLDYPRSRFEAILVDDGSPVPVTVPDHHGCSGLMMTLLRQRNAGPAAARNLGAQRARGDVLAFTDDDCCPSPHWLREVVRTLEGHPTALVGGRTVNALETNLFSAASQLIVDEAYAYLFSRSSDLRFFASNNLAVPTRRFRECGGFNPSFRTSEDREFCDRWLRRGEPLVYAPEAVVQHRHHLTMPGFCRQHFHYGRGAHRFHRVRWRRNGIGVTPDMRFYASVCRRALRTALPWKTLHMAALVGMWQAANLAGFLWQACADAPAVVRLTGGRGLAQPAEGWAMASPTDRNDGSLMSRRIGRRQDEGASSVAGFPVADGRR